MAYSCDYHLIICHNEFERSIDHDSICQQFKKIKATLNYQGGPDCEAHFISYGPAWENWNQALVEFSATNPDLLIHAYWSGEDRDDIGHAKFHNGKSCMKNAKLVYPEIALDDLV